MNRRQFRKLKMATTAASAVVLMVAFQNCGRSDLLSAAANSAISGEANVDYNKIQAKQFHEIVINDGLNARSFDLDIDSGVAMSLDNKRYCLDDLDRQQIQDILSLAEVCEPMNKPINPDLVCSMIYKFPYAELRSSGQAYKLGESRDGCDIPVDLCGDGAAELKSYIGGLLARIDSLACN